MQKHKTGIASAQDPLQNAVADEAGGGSAVGSTMTVDNNIDSTLLGVDGPLSSDIKQFGPTWDPPLPLLLTGTSGPGNGQQLASLDKLVIGLVRTKLDSPPYFRLYVSVEYVATSRGYSTFIPSRVFSPMTLLIYCMDKKDGVVLGTQTIGQVEFACGSSQDVTQQNSLSDDLFDNTNFVRFNLGGGLFYKC